MYECKTKCQLEKTKTCMIDILKSGINDFLNL